jgi:protein SCO1/2
MLPCVRALTLTLVLVASWAASSPAAGHEAHSPPAGDAQAARTDTARVELPDVVLLDQDGKRVRFRSDVVGDRRVAIDVIYTTCPVVCPILSAAFAGVQDGLGDRLGREAALVSISVDPLTDIPPRLKAYARKWGARPGWVFLTGAKPDVDRVLRGLGLYAADFTAHSTVVLVGSAAQGAWSRLYGLPTPERILERLQKTR